LFKTMSVSLNSKLLPTCKDSNVFSNHLLYFLKLKLKFT
jgi:hypothetical protein